MKAWIFSQRRSTARHQHGAAIVETVMVLPLLLGLILGGVQWGMVFEAKATLNHAVLQAARAGAVDHANPTSMRRAFARGVLPLFSPDSSIEGVTRTLARIEADMAGNLSLRILNPTLDAFRDFAVNSNGEREIPSDRMHQRPTAVGAHSGLSIQDVNLLRVQVRYGYELNVPIVGRFITAATQWVNNRRGNADPFEQRMLSQGRLPVIATTTVRMQTPARESNLVQARADLQNVERVAASGGEPTAPIGGDLPALEGQFNEDGSGLDDGFFGFNPLPDRDSGGGGGGEFPFPIGGGGGMCQLSCCGPARPRPFG